MSHDDDDKSDPSTRVLPPLPFLPRSGLAASALTIDEDVIAPSPPGPITPQLIPGLTAEELQALRYKGEDPRDFVAIVAPSMLFQLKFQDLQPTDAKGHPVGPPQRFIVFVPTIPIPPSLVPADTSTLIDAATGQPMLSERLRKAFVPEAPMVLRFVVRRNALAPEARAGLERAETGACLPPTPPRADGPGES